MKKSLFEVIERAKAMSNEFPDICYYVMDKKGKRAICISDATYRERVLDGYYTYCKFLNGKVC